MDTKPFTLLPKDGNKDKAILLVHGFLVTPYIMRSLAEFYQSEGFMVRAILLPGHGTSFEALYDVTWQDWYQSVADALTELQREAKEVHLCGYSLGGTLSLLAALEFNLASLTLIAPALGIEPIAGLFPLMTMLKRGRYLPLLNTVWGKGNVGIYQSYPAYSVGQVYLAINEIWRRYPKCITLPPTFVTASECDRTVRINDTLKFFKRIESKKAMRLYGVKGVAADPAIELINDRFNPCVLAMSHVAMPVAPSDPYYGENGSYYGPANAKIRFGEPGLIGLYFQQIKRLTYNPDFTGMTKAIRTFFNY